MHEWLDKILRFIYPRCCVFCGELIRYEDKNYICAACADKVSEICGTTCEMCGRPIEYPGRCRQCNSTKHRFDAGFAVYLYEGDVRKAIHRFKYGGRGGYAEFFGRAMAIFASYSDVPEVDFVCPVPIHSSRYHNRGYNQSELLARVYVEQRGERLESLLKRVVNTKPQSGLKSKERAENMKNAFAMSDKADDIKGKSILLIDDIFTTGNTVDECTRVLKKNGAAHVYVLCLSVRALD